ncbi:MAG: YbaB/EbfC family nucleoid-associated protein [bacterium]
MANIFNMLKQAHTLKREMGKVSAGLATIESEGVSRKGQVSVKMDGTMKITKVTIAPELVAKGDVRAIEEMVVEAAQNAREKAQGLAAASMKKIAGDIPLPF